MGIDVVMFCIPEREVPDEELRWLSYSIAEAFWYENFLIFRPEDDAEPSHALERVKLRDIYGYDITVDGYGPETEVIQVNLAGRFYDVEYERGNLPLYIAVAWWLEIRIGGRVYYGGDVSESTLMLFDEQKRSELFEYFARVGHQPYKQADNLPPCDFCGGPMYENRWICRDGAWIAIGWRCPGCGHTVEKETKGGE